MIRGGTPHFDYVCSAATDGLTRVALDTGVAGRLRRCSPATTEEQALDRAGLEGSHGGQGLRGHRGGAGHRPTLRTIRAATTSSGVQPSARARRRGATTAATTLGAT